MRCHRSRPWAPWAVALMTAGCTRVSDRSRFEGPEQPLEILTSDPRPGALGVPADVRIDLCMSDRLDPRSLDEVDANVSSGGTLTDSELSVQLIPWLAPGQDEPPEDLDAPWCEGSVLSVEPRAQLRPGARYRLRLAPSAVGWAGESISTEGPLWVVDEAGEHRYILEFTIDDAPPALPPMMPDPPEEVITLHDLFDAGGPFDPARPLCSCHRDPADTALALLDLREPTAAFEDLLGSARPRDTGFPMVSPRDPSQSFLVQKLARDRHDEPLYGVLGDAMPPEAPAPYEDLLAIIAWIQGGAAL